MKKFSISLQIPDEKFFQIHRKFLMKKFLQSPIYVPLEPPGRERSDRRERSASPGGDPRANNCKQIVYATNGISGSD